MTLDEFYAALERTPRKWELRSISLLGVTGAIRLPRGDYLEPCCPIISVSPPVLWPKLHWLVAPLLNLPEGAVQAIIDAADNRPGHDPAIRARLLAACGLTEDAS